MAAHPRLRIEPRQRRFWPRPLAATVVGAYLLLELIVGGPATVIYRWDEHPAPGVVHQQP